MSNAVAKALLGEKRVAELGNLLARGNVIEMNLVCTAAGEKRPVRTEGDGVGWVKSRRQRRPASGRKGGIRAAACGALVNPEGQQAQFGGREISCCHIIICGRHHGLIAMGCQ